jgi:ribosomal protein L11 methylase PrmA
MTVHGPRHEIEQLFGLLVPAQPTSWTSDGLVLFPQAATDAAAACAAIAMCPLPIVPGGAMPDGWPQPAAALVAGIYRRSPHHAPAPQSIHEILQVQGEAFGPGDHATTAMCLAYLRRLPPGDTLDVGCGSGLLALARARLAEATVLAVDVDPEAVRQARRSVELSGLDHRVTVRADRAGTLAADALADRVVLANIPAHAHKELAARMSAPPRALLVSGLTATDAAEILRSYRALEMHRVAASQRGRWQCHLLVANHG